MQYFMTQCGATVILSLLRWAFIWTNTTENNVSWPIINNLFYMVMLTWLFTLGFFVKGRMDENVQKLLEEEKDRSRSRRYQHEEEVKKLNSKLNEILKERERFLVLIENMVSNVGMKKADFVLEDGDSEVLEKEKAVIKSFAH